MAEQIKGEAVVWGIHPLRPISNMPRGAIFSVRMRKNVEAHAIVTLEDRVEDWVLQPEGKISINAPRWILGKLVAVDYHSL